MNAARRGRAAETARLLDDGRLYIGWGILYAASTVVAASRANGPGGRSRACFRGRRAVLAVSLALLAAVAAPAVVASPTASVQTTFYVSPSGSDTAAGTSPATAWRTLRRVNRAELAAGTRILLQGGETFIGSLVFGRSDSGNPRDPISVGSYGAGRATIETQKDGVDIHDTAGIRIGNVRIVGAGLSSPFSGISAVNDLHGNVKLPYLRVENVEISNFGKYGILVDGRNGRSGFRDVRITNAVVHDNALAGIDVEGPFAAFRTVYAHRDVYVGYSRVYDNPGVTSNPDHTGDGIVLSNVDRGTIEYCKAHDNGRLASGVNGGPVGIWAWQANRIVIQHNESYRNHVIGKKDGGGFDLDGGMTNSIIQYNDSHDNDGPGYQALQFKDAGPHQHNTIRFNSSWNDARKTGPAALLFSGGIRDLRVYRNTVFVSPRGLRPVAAVAVTSLKLAAELPVTTGVHIYGNVFQAVGGALPVFVEGRHGDLRFVQNDYYSKGRPLAIYWNGTAYRTLAAWRAATGQERVRGRNTGSTANPNLRQGSSDPFWLVLGGEVAFAAVLLGAGTLALRRLAPRG
jgi:hypothetical protein